MDARMSRTDYPAWRFHLTYGIALAAILVCYSPARAQLNVAVLNGDLGLQSGSQPPPGLYLSTLYSDYRAGEVKTAGGDVVDLKGGTLVTSLFITSISGVLDYKLLGAHIGANLALPWAQSRAEFPPLDAFSSGWNFADMYVCPVWLGWHLPIADITAYYGLILPTGEFDPEATVNAGLDQWSNLVGLGTTLFTDSTHQYHFSINAEYAIQSEKRSQEGVQAGNILTLEGGLGATLLKGLLTAGGVYYAQFKVTHDQDSLLPAIFDGRHRYLGAGPELDLALPLGKSLFAQLVGRYYFEFWNESATQGNALIVNLTLGLPKGGV
jgi:hypothetical protein